MSEILKDADNGVYKNKNVNGELNWEASIGVTLASFLSAVALFFTGLVIAQYDSFDQTIKLPLLFLIVSTFSFIFAAAIYSNAGIEITMHRFKTVEKYLEMANNILEFMGIYLFILAVPLVIGAVTQDYFLRVSAISVGLTALALYSQSSFSILHKELTSKKRKMVITVTLVVLGLSMYFYQELAKMFNLFGYEYVGSALLVFQICLTVVFCRNSKQYINKEIDF